ncbi:hypothetical protein FOZ62_002201 [Perkinsus olseni]|uniref:Uncharacterized protein n=2 Tax=Perkinsus olseni TaxID=32597 RepID=A0A7J6N0L9_PEROL|nr:hypothetical protein FOZ62_002201 [Perkinsus olseni]
MAILSLLIALLFCTLPCSVAQTLGGCLSGFYKFSSKKSNAETPIADADPPVKALDFSFTPEGDCSVAFILYADDTRVKSFSALYSLDDGNILKLRSVGEVPSEYAAEFNKLASMTTLLLLTFDHKPPKSVVMYWNGGVTHYQRLTLHPQK